MIITLPDALAAQALASLDGPDLGAKTAALEALILDFVAAHVLAAGVAALDARWRAERDAVEIEVANLRADRAGDVQ